MRLLVLSWLYSPLTLTWVACSVKSTERERERKRMKERDRERRRKEVSKGERKGDNIKEQDTISYQVAQIAAPPLLLALYIKAYP